ncbi:virulence factor family protein [Solimonas sp. K1W22B-7]|uniref:virulence factor family protein n=1 Tax=Solimonas sp. K1W22B-7 TaxID=2303331 RepID=UPI000E336A04|nr:AcvB/VirJ family lysyl-phosphatidylglycerol hydrolase [Solimonas sp. K1W22B-7]AXQ31227.1 virulence factor family protein [Solimonas sp. K1W22B-7]
MKRMLSMLLLAAAMPLAQAGETLTHGRFDDFTLERPPGPPRSFALLLTDRGGDRNGLARALTQEGALVAVIDTETFFARMEKDGGDCQFANGDLENLSRHMQGYAQVNGYYPPILVGQGIGAGFAYGLLGQSDASTFTAGLALDFCPELAMKQPLCKGDGGLRSRRNKRGWEYRPGALRDPFAVLQPPEPSCSAGKLQRFLRQVPQAAMGTLKDPANPAALRAAYRSLASRLPPPPAARTADVADLPLLEMPAQQPGKAFAIFLSGDGGWAGLDQEVSERLMAKGVSVVGFDSLRYFWKARTPEGIGADLARVIRHYQAAWQRPDVWLVGFSQGGDVLPFALSRLPAELRAQVKLAAPMAQTEQAHFEFHLSNWIGAEGTHPILPEMEKLAGAAEMTVICAREEDESVCRQLDPKRFRIVWLPGGHHFNGDYAKLAQTLLQAAPKR